MEDVSKGFFRIATCIAELVMSRTMVSPWQRRIQRAQELLQKHAFAAEFLTFYIQLAAFQDKWHAQLSFYPLAASSHSSYRPLIEEELPIFGPQFEAFLSLAEEHAPKTLAAVSRELRAQAKTFRWELLANAWKTSSPADAQTFLAQAFLQPYAEILRARAILRPVPQKYAICPFCTRKPGFGVLRPRGEGAARSMVCSFCLAEWDFRRIVCPGCGEEKDPNLVVFSASDFDYIRVECCDTCKTYLKTIDLTRNGHAEPMVDELASVSLDLWAQGRGYAKLHPNLLGM